MYFMHKQPFLSIAVNKKKVMEKSQKTIDKQKKPCYNHHNIIKAVTRTRTFTFLVFRDLPFGARQEPT